MAKREPSEPKPVECWGFLLHGVLQPYAGRTRLDAERFRLAGETVIPVVIIARALAVRLGIVKAKKGAKP